MRAAALGAVALSPRRRRAGSSGPGAGAGGVAQRRRGAPPRRCRPGRQAARHWLGDGDLPEWRALMRATRRLFGSVLGLPLPDKLFINAWRLGRGDSMSVHPDGRLYCGTLSLGLCRGWTAADGGAIAIGEPTKTGFLVRERWLPHLGDVLLFAPGADTWHAVEPV